jgi:DNA-binding MarR family transcriptional regulator
VTGQQDATDIAAQAAGSHPALGFDDVVHQRTRLGILAVLAEATEADFTYVRKVLDLTDGNLGRHLEILEGAGLITVSKGYHGRRPRTRAAITAEGRRALRRELASMQALVQRLDSAVNPHETEPGRPADADADRARSQPSRPAGR